LVSLPGIVVSLVIGVAVAIFSATTQIQEQALSVIIRLVASARVVLMIVLPNP
jgi:flagellar biosynthetic protein FliQ